MPIITEAISTVTITGDPMFDFFFTLNLVSGLLTFGVCSLIKIGSRS